MYSLIAYKRIKQLNITVGENQNRKDDFFHYLF